MIIEDLRELEEESITRKIPIIGREKGQWLLQKVQKLKPKRILELGSANGYSGIILASEGGSLITIEQDEVIAAEAEQNFEEFMIDVEVIIGEGVEKLHKLVYDENIGSFDLIFIDFAKKKYISVLEDCIKLLRIGGLIIADNIEMEGCRDFKGKITIDSRLKTYFVPIKDGISCSEKIK